MNAQAIVNSLLETEEAERYLHNLPPRFDAEEVLQKLRYDLSADLDFPSETRDFIAWLKENENLFPDVVKAQAVAAANDYWSTESDEDMEAFFEAIGFPQTDPICPRCDGTGAEPGAPFDEDADGNVLMPLCARCHGSGQRILGCECAALASSTEHRPAETCSWCRARGRFYKTDPEISPTGNGGAAGKAGET